MGKVKQKGNGQGTIFKNNKTGLYIGQYYFEGKRHSIYQKKSEKITDFKNRFNDILSSINQGNYIESKDISLYQILNNFIENKYKSGIIKDRSYTRNKETLKQLKKCFADIVDKPIQKITIEQVKKCLPNLREFKNISSKTNKITVKSYSQSTINKIYALLRKGFKIAMSERITTYNILDNINLQKPKSKKVDKTVEALTLEEEKKLINLLNKSDYKYKNIILLTLYTGLRIGETLALTRNDINFKNQTLTINKTLTRDKNDKVILGETTKTINGTRIIYLSDNAIKILKDSLKVKINNIYNLIFFDYNKNTFITPNEINCFLQRFNKKYNICPHIHTHMLRHTYATRCIEAGMSAKVLQKNLGHAKIQTTLDTYTSVFEKYNKEENEKYNSYMKENGL